MSRPLGTTDVMIVRHLTETCANLTKWLRLKGAVINWVSEDQGVIDATVSDYTLDEIRNKPCVAYLRTMHHYPHGVPTEEGIEVHPTDDAL